MLAAVDNNPLIEFHDVLYKAIKGEIQTKDISNEPILKLILDNNGCGFTDNCTYGQEFLKCTKDYGIYFLYGASANAVNECFDYLDFYGMKYLIVFMDYFKDFYTNKNTTDEIENTLNDLMGNSIYFDAIKKIVDTFISTTVPAAELMGSLSTTAASSNYRFAGIFIAASIIDKEVGLTENDVTTINFNDLRTMLDNIQLQLLLLGIKFKD